MLKPFNQNLMDSNIKQSLPYGLKLDYKTSSSFNDLSSQPKTRIFDRLFRRNRTQILPLGAVRLQNNVRTRSYTNYKKNKLITFSTLFLLCIFLAIVNNSFVRSDTNNFQQSVFGIRSSTSSTVESPDFYFIESSQFIPGSERLTLASYNVQDHYKPKQNEPIVIDNIPEIIRTTPLVTKNSIDHTTDNLDLAVARSSRDKHVSQLIKVKSGDTLSQILLKHGLEGSELQSFLNLEAIEDHLATLLPNQEFTIRHSQTGEFVDFAMRLGKEKKLLISKENSAFVGSILTLPITREYKVSSAVIDSSLFLAGQSAGLSQKTIMNLVDIFRWDIDFSLDIRKGDKFRIVYEELYRNGESLGEGDILAADFVNGSRSVKAIRYTDIDGRTNYYTPSGRSMRKAFLRNPVDVVRITSHYNPNRKHPVLHTIRAHKGTDYGAPIGTPIRSTGEGRIIFSGRKGGYGNTVIIKHGDKYTTLYAHMSKFAKSIKTGKRIQQGQIIGYVGRTGRVTGAHLHYEFKINNKHKNPLKVRLPGAKPIPTKYYADFKRKSKEYIALLDETLPNNTVASR